MSAALLATCAAALLTATPAAAQDTAAAPAMPGMDHAPPAQSHDMAGMDMSHMDMPGMDMGQTMRGALGGYTMTREASGTSWQPDASTHEGLHLTAGPWMVMVHGVLNAVYAKQYGPRGDEKGFVSGMLIAMAHRPIAHPPTLPIRPITTPAPSI